MRPIETSTRTLEGCVAQERTDDTGTYITLSVPLELVEDDTIPEGINWDTGSLKAIRGCRQ